MLAAAAATVLWEMTFHDTGALFFVRLDAKDGALYTGG